MAEFKYTNLERELLAYGEEVAEKYKDNLVAEGHSATATLYNTVRPNLEKSEDGFVLSLWMQDYWKYLERGTRMQGPYRQKGDPPPFGAILKWVQIKPVIPWNDKLRRMPQEKAQKAMAAMIRHHIWEYGTKPLWLLRDSVGKEEDVKERMQNAVRRDIEEWLNESVNEIR